MFELGHAQVSDSDEVLHGTKATCRSLGLLQQPVHRLNVRIAASIKHAAHYPVEAFGQGVGQALERLQSATPRPRQPGTQSGAGLCLAVGGQRPGIHLAQCLLQPSGRQLRQRFGGDDQRAVQGGVDPPPGALEDKGGGCTGHVGMGVLVQSPSIAGAHRLHSACRG